MADRDSLSKWLNQRGEHHVDHLMVELVTGRLSESERTRVFAHLDRCPSCSRALAEWSSIDRRLRATNTWDPPLPSMAPALSRLERTAEHFPARPLDSETANDGPRVRRGKAGVAAFSIAAVAAAAVVAVALTHVGTSPRTPVATQSEDPGNSPGPAKLSGPAVQLANYTFHLPVGYNVAPGELKQIEMTSDEPNAVAVSFTTVAGVSGSIDIALSTMGSSPEPAGAVRTTVGPYEGYVVAASAAQEHLVVAVPGGPGAGELTLTGTRVPLGQLIAIAVSGLAGPAGGSH